MIDSAHVLALLPYRKDAEPSPRLRSIGKLIIVNKLSLDVEVAAEGYAVGQAVIMVGGEDERKAS